MSSKSKSASSAPFGSISGTEEAGGVGEAAAAFGRRQRDEFKLETAELEMPDRGRVVWRVGDGIEVNPGTLVAVIESDAGQFELASPVMGRVKRRVNDSEAVDPGTIIAEIHPKSS